MRLIIFLLLAFFATTTVTAQLYDNRSRYLRTPYEDESVEQNLNTFQKPTKRPYSRNTQSYNSRRYSNYRSPNYFRSDSYEDYQNRVSRYSEGSLGHNEFYNRFRSQYVYDIRHEIANYYSKKKTESSLGLNDCHCNFRVDVNDAFQRWYRTQQLIRERLLQGYEKLFEKKIENLLNKQFPNFKSAQKHFFKEYINVHNDWYHRRIGPFVREDYINQENLLEKNTAFYNVARKNMNHTRAKNIYKKEYAEVAKSNQYLLISKELHNRLNHKKLPYHGYIVDKYINHYNKQSNYEYKLGMFNGYLVYYKNRHKPLYYQPNDKYSHTYYNNKYDEKEVLEYMKNLIKKEVHFRDYMPNLSLEYSKAIVSFYNMTFPQRSITKYISAGRWGRIPVKVPVPGTPLKCQENNSIQNNPELEGIKQAILNKTSLKKAVFRYLANTKGNGDSQKTVLEAVGCTLKNSAFEWSEIGKFRQSDSVIWREIQNPEVVFIMDLFRSYNPNELSQDEYLLYLKTGLNPRGEYLHKGIGDVLKNLYTNEKYRFAEGATMRFFLKEKGLNVPSSLSNYDLGKLFDFGGGNSNTLTIQFSPFAKKHILSFPKGNGAYRRALFTDPFKLQALKEILKGNTVDFEDRIINDLTGKAKCVYNKLKNLDLFKKTINKFDNIKSHNLILTNKGSCVGGGSGCTNFDEKSNTATIKIIDTKQPSLDMAATILHEGIHADIYKFVSQHEKGKVNPNDRPRLMQLYFYYKKLADSKVIDPKHFNTIYQHEYMAEKYIKPIAEAIRQLDGNRFNLNHYYWFAWEGLEKTYSFKSQLSESEKQEYKRNKSRVNDTTNFKCN